MLHKQKYQINQDRFFSSKYIVFNAKEGTIGNLSFLMPLHIVEHKLKEHKHHPINFQVNTVIAIKQWEFIVCNAFIV